MNPIEFPEVNAVLAKNQPQYRPLPVHVDAEGVVTSCWQLSWRERLTLLFTGIIWWQQMTFGAPLQPQKPDVQRPLM